MAPQSSRPSNIASSSNTIPVTTFIASPTPMPESSYASLANEVAALKEQVTEMSLFLTSLGMNSYNPTLSVAHPPPPLPCCQIHPQNLVVHSVQPPTQYQSNHPRPPPFSPHEHLTSRHTHCTKPQTVKKTRIFTPLNESRSSLFAKLHNAGVLDPVKRVVYHVLPRSFDPNKTCAYHSNSSGHDTESCMALKHKIQNLIDEGGINLQNSGSNVANNPLPDHGNAPVT